MSVNIQTLFPTLVLNECRHGRECPYFGVCSLDEREVDSFGAITMYTAPLLLILV